MTLAAKQAENGDIESQLSKRAPIIDPLRNVPIKPVKFRMARRRLILNEAITIPQRLQDHINSEYGGLDSMLLEEVADAVNSIYKPLEVARLRRTSARRSMTLYEVHQMLFNLVFNYKPEN